MKATSAYLNLPLRTETQAKCQILPARFKGWHSFEVRKVYYGDEHTGSYLLEDEQGPPKSEPDAFGVYGVPPDEDLQYHVSDCKTLIDALTLKEVLGLHCYTGDMSIGKWVLESTPGATPDLYKRWSAALERSKAGDDLLVEGDGWKFYRVPVE